MTEDKEREFIKTIMKKFLSSPDKKPYVWIMIYPQESDLFNYCLKYLDVGWIDRSSELSIPSNVYHRLDFLFPTIKNSLYE